MGEEMKKIEEHAGIQIPIYYYEDDDGNKVYDYEEMAEEFENEIIDGKHYVDDIFTVDVSSKQRYYVVLKTYNTKMIEEIKVLKVTQPVK